MTLVNAKRARYAHLEALVNNVKELRKMSNVAETKKRIDLRQHVREQAGIEDLPNFDEEN